MMKPIPRFRPDRRIYADYPRFPFIGTVGFLILGAGSLVGLQLLLWTVEFPAATVVVWLTWPGMLVLAWWLLSLVPSFVPVKVSTRLLAFLWGGTVAVLVAGEANSAGISLVTSWWGIHLATDWAAAVVAPLTEEFIKCVGIVVVILMTRRAVSPVDGFVIGAMVGLGFQVFEDVSYAYYGTSELAQDSPEVAFTYFILRAALTGFASHWLFSAVAGAGIAFFVATRSHTASATAMERADATVPGVVHRWTVLIGSLAVAVALHGLWNSPVAENLAGYAAKTLVCVVVIVPVILWSRRWESRVFVPYLATVPDWLLSATDRADLASPRTRWRARRRTPRSQRRAVRRLQRAHCDLAGALAAYSQSDVDRAVRQITQRQAGFYRVTGRTQDPLPAPNLQ